MKKDGFVGRDPITICVTVNGWTLQRFLIWHQRKVTREHAPLRSLVSFASLRKPVRQHHLSMRQTRLLLFVEASPFQVDRLVSYLRFST